MKLSIKLLVAHKNAPITEIALIGEVKVTGTPIDEHDLAAVIFSSEFAINNNSGKHLDKPIRAHFLLE